MISLGKIAQPVGTSTFRSATPKRPLPLPGVEQILSTREQLGRNAEIVPLPEHEFEN